MGWMEVLLQIQPSVLPLPVLPFHSTNDQCLRLQMAYHCERVDRCWGNVFGFLIFILVFRLLVFVWDSSFQLLLCLETFQLLSHSSGAHFSDLFQLSGLAMSHLQTRAVIVLQSFPVTITTRDATPHGRTDLPISLEGPAQVSEGHIVIPDCYDSSITP